MDRLPVGTVRLRGVCAGFGLRRVGSISRSRSARLRSACAGRARSTTQTVPPCLREFLTCCSRGLFVAAHTGRTPSCRLIISDMTGIPLVCKFHHSSRRYRPTDATRPDDSGIRRSLADWRPVSGAVANVHNGPAATEPNRPRIAGAHRVDIETIILPYKEHHGRSSKAPGGRGCRDCSGFGIAALKFSLAAHEFNRTPQPGRPHSLRAWGSARDARKGGRTRQPRPPRGSTPHSRPVR